jgi:diaminopimelate epimerase
MIAISKYHGCGNNFVIVKEADLINHLGGACEIEDYSEFAKQVCNINTGVGADGFIVVREEPELEMVFFNCDGSRAPMCGNGIRCFAQYCYDQGIRQEDSYKVKTLAGDMVVDVASRSPFRVKINMGRPILAPSSVGINSDESDYLDKTLELSEGRSVKIDSLFMGTIHTVVMVDDIDSEEIPVIGEEICNHPLFSEKTNVNFVKVVDEETLIVKTYERGVGMTLACGTGACASVVVANMKGLCQRSTKVILALGILQIEINEDVYMEDPSMKIFDGEFC